VIPTKNVLLQKDKILSKQKCKFIIIIMQPWRRVVGRRPQRAVSVSACPVLASIRCRLPVLA